MESPIHEDNEDDDVIVVEDSGDDIADVEGDDVGGVKDIENFVATVDSG